jgi:hypothetical protein
LDKAQPTKLNVEKPGSELISPEPGANLASEQVFDDCVVEMEFMIPADSNSGIKMMNIYEIQILDSAAKAKVDSGDCGAVYKESAPKVNACKKQASGSNCSSISVPQGSTELEKRYRTRNSSG